MIPSKQRQRGAMIRNACIRLADEKPISWWDVVDETKCSYNACRRHLRVLAKDGYLTELPKTDFVRFERTNKPYTPQEEVGLYLSLPDRVLAALRETPGMTIDEIANSMGVAYKDGAHTALKTLMGCGLVLRNRTNEHRSRYVYWPAEQAPQDATTGAQSTRELFKQDLVAGLIKQPTYQKQLHDRHPGHTSNYFRIILAELESDGYIEKEEISNPNGGLRKVWRGLKPYTANEIVISRPKTKTEPEHERSKWMSVKWVSDETRHYIDERIRAAGLRCAGVY